LLACFLACLKRKLFTKERRGLVIGSGRIPEPSMLRTNYTTEGKASNLLRHPLYSRIFSGPFGPTGHCAQAVVEHSVES